MLHPGDIATWEGERFRYRGRTFYRVDFEELETCAGCEQLVADHPHVWSTEPSTGGNFFYCEDCHSLVEGAQPRSKKTCSSDSARPVRSITRS